MRSAVGGSPLFCDRFQQSTCCVDGQAVAQALIGLSNVRLDCTIPPAYLRMGPFRQGLCLAFAQGFPPIASAVEPFYICTRCIFFLILLLLKYEARDSPDFGGHMIEESKLFLPTPVLLTARFGTILVVVEQGCLQQLGVFTRLIGYLLRR